MVFAGVLHGVDDIRYEDVPISKIQEDEVLVEVQCAGICGSDIPRVKTVGTYHFPTVPGHEFAGIVVERGNEVQNVKVGDRVTAYPLIPCGNCSYCKKDEENLCENYNYLGSRCDGGFAEQVKCPAKNVLKVPTSVSFEEAALIEPIAVALRGVKRGKVKRGNQVVVFGMGPIGLFTAQWAKLMGASLVVGVDRNDHKLEIAKEMGIDIVVNSDWGNCDEEIKKSVDGEVDVVLECSGADVFRGLAIELIKKGGIISLVGNPKRDVSFKEKNFQKILRKEITLVGSWNSLVVGENEWQTAITFLAAGRLKVSPMITHHFKLKEIKQVFDDLYERKIENYCKGVFLYD